MPRQYQLKERAASMGQTRDRIIEATVSLHASVGPARTSIAKIAERAGVQRHTVYRHFPSQRDLLLACSQHYWARNKWNPLSSWVGIQDAEALTTALRALYDFYGRNEDVIYRSLRDAADEPDVEIAMRSYRDHLAEVRGLLVESLTPSASRVDDLRVATAHALAFETWFQLARGSGATNEQAARLMASAVMTVRRGRAE
jgi:AcrR family transcriptional regulator